MVVVMFLVATIVFVISHVIPGDPAAVMLGPSATAADIAALRTRLGLDASLPV
jgi:peptide/nickel transport system permease protein